MNKKLTFLSFAALLSVNSLFGSTTFGYSNETVGKNYTFRVGSQTNQGLAIRLSNEKLQLFKGKTISEIRAAFGSKNATDGAAKLFVAADMTSPLSAETVSISGTNKWVNYPLSQPYQITGDELELYVGYTLEIGTQYGPLSADFSQDTEGVCYALTTDGWQDLYGKGYGCANIELVFAEDIVMTDALLKSTTITGYNRVGEELDCPLQLVNLGTTKLQSCTVEVAFGQSEKKQFEIKDLALEPHATYDIELPQIATTEAGNQQVTFSLATINGEVDDEPSDNLASVATYFYPADMQRNLLLEVFTGQTCSNCPTGHSSLQSALSQTGLPVIEVSHHSGYVADIFSMQEDWDILGLYDGVTYAPAGMVNRMTTEGNTSPVFDVNSVSGNVKVLNAVNEEEPYVSIALNAPYDATTRTIDLTTSIYTHRLPTDDTEFRYTLYLVQDSLIAYQQSGGADYVHQSVCRGCLTEGAWGEKISLEAGKTLTLSKTVVLPDTIVSTYYTKDDGRNHIATDVPNMRIVAVVHQYNSKNVGLNRVLNSAEVSIGKNYKQGGFPEASAGVRRLVRQTFYGDAQGYELLTTATRTVDYFYNSTGDLSRAVETSKYVNLEQWGLTHYYKYDYNDAGLLTRTYSLQYGSFDYGDLGFFAARDTITYQYNEKGQLICERHPLSYYLYEYDEEGRCTKKSTWNINNISGEETNDLVEQFGDFNEQGNPRKVTATSPEGKSWNEYSGVYTYDELGHLTAIHHYTTDEGLLCYAEYWDYEGDFLKTHRMALVWGDGTEEEGQSEEFEYVDGDTNRIRCTMPSTGTSYINEYADVCSSNAPVLTVEAVEGEINTLELHVSFPTGGTSADIYRDGILVADNVTDSFIDKDLVNGDYEYLAVCRNAASPLVSMNTYVELPVVTGLHSVSAHKDLLGNNYIVVAWNQPEVASELGFVRNDLMLANMQTAELTTDDPNTNEFEINLGIEKEVVCYILSVYKYGKVASAQITANINKIGEDALETIGADNVSKTRIYDLHGNRLKTPKSGQINLIENQKVWIY